MKTERKYEIDWLRILLILSVFIYHIGMIFNPWDWHIKNETQYSGLSYIMSFLHYWRMPMLFFISGVGTYFALGKRKIGAYVKERTHRLIIPLIFGIFLLVPIQVYIERIEQYSSLWDFYLHIFDGIYPSGNFSWHHLWFLVYLFFCSMLIIPFIRFYQSKKSIKFKLLLRKIIHSRFGLYLFSIPLIISQIILRPYFPEETHDFVNDWAYLALDFLYFLYGFILLSNDMYIKEIYSKRHGMMIMAVLFTAIMYSAPHLFSKEIAGTVWDISGLFLSWFLCLSLVGYSQDWLRIDNKWRKIGNEMIYPFYLLHQPVIVFLGYYIVQFETNDFLKFIIVLSSSFIFTITLYFLMIRPSRYLRIIFGVKKTAPIKIENKLLKKEKFLNMLRKAS
ncbi:MAG: acyltransferase family protein [Thiohalospira sp.]